MQELDDTEWAEGDTKLEAKQTVSSSKSPVKRNIVLESSLNEEHASSSQTSQKKKRKEIDSSIPQKEAKPAENESSSNVLSGREDHGLKSVSLEKSLQKLGMGKKESDDTKQKDCGLKSVSLQGSSKKVETERKQPEEPEVVDSVISYSPPSYMWVDKYKPTTTKQIIGQQGDKSNVKKLLNWLSSWHSNHGPGVNKKLVRPSE